MHEFGDSKQQLEARVEPLTLPAASPSAAESPPDTGTLLQAFAVVQEGLRSMQLLQQQTAAAHQQFLHGQARAHESFQRMLEAHQRLVAQSLGLPGSTPAAMQAVESPMTTIPPAPPTLSEPATVAQTAVPPNRALDPDPPIPIRPADALSTPVPAGPRAASKGDTPVARTRQGKRANGDGKGNGHACAPRNPPPPARRQPQTDRFTPSAPDDAPRHGVSGRPDFGRVLLEVVAELTGYPVEMLNLSMDMEADLGIDSIKRLEILSAVQRRTPDLPQVNSQHVGSLRTLQNIIDYMEHPADGDAGATPAAPSREPAIAGPAGEAPTKIEAARVAARKLDVPRSGVARRVLRVVELPPVAAAALRVASGFEFVVVDDGTPLAPAVARSLRAAGTAAEVIDLERAAKRAAPPGGLVLLAPPPKSGHLLIRPAASEFMKSAFLAAKAAAGGLQLAAKRGAAIFATVSRLDGRFGLSQRGFDPVQGALAGLAKTAADEWPDVRCRAIDVDAEWADPERIAGAIVRELASDGPIEVGLSPHGRYGLELVTATANGGAMPLNTGDVVLVSGGARGVTAEAAVALARAARPTLVLLGRAPAPAEEPSWSAGVEDEAALKRRIVESAGAAARQSPAQVEQRFRDVLAAREIHRNLARIDSAGARVIYRSVDVRDEECVEKLVDEIRREYGAISGLIHGAGVIEDRLIAEKSLDAFARVYDTKVAGLASLLAATQRDDLKLVALFSSVSGRFGRRGQVDYAMANEVLNKTAQRIAAARPGCRVVSINWGPWGGGMVTPALRRAFVRGGIELLDLEAGGTAFVDELRCAERGDVEVVIGAALEARPEPAAAVRARRDGPSQNNGELTVAFERTLDVAGHPFLESHVINGNPVLPVAVMLEWLGHAALHENPGLLLHGFEDFRVLKGVVLANGPQPLQVAVSRPRRRGERFEVEVELRGDSGSRPHARARAILVDDLPAHPTAASDEDVATRAYPRDAAGAYQEILFHGPAFHGIRRVLGYSSRGMAAEVRPAPAPQEWMSHPPRSEWLTDPLAVDSGLQLGLLWLHEHVGAGGLPSAVAGYRQYRTGFPRDGLKAILEVRESDARRLVADLTFVDGVGDVVARLERGEWIVHRGLETPARAARQPAVLV
jgi:NAD(P)-dependent dehydrogenase (short-subunit alcohol dehydrogenase family)